MEILTLHMPVLAQPGWVRNSVEAEEDKQMTENWDTEEDAGWPGLQVFPVAAPGGGFHRCPGERDWKS